MLSFLQLIRNITQLGQGGSSARMFSNTISSSANTSVFSAVPEIPIKAKIIFPISMNRYLGSIDKRDAYDHVLETLLSATAKKLENSEVQQIDVVSTAELHASWPNERVQELTAHFYHRHASILERHSNYYTWNELVQKLGTERHKEQYERVKFMSKEGTEWYRLMEDAHKRTKSSDDLISSLEYQRQEYAGILCMSDYSHILYFGKISPAWAYIYSNFKDDFPPLFVRALLQQTPLIAPSKMLNNDVVFRAVENLIEEIIASPSVPKEKKISLHDHVNALFKAHVPTGSRVIDDSSFQSTEQSSQGFSV